MSGDRNLYRIEDSIEASCGPEPLMRKILGPRTWPDWQSEIVRAEGPDLIEEGDQVTGDARLVGFKVQGRSDAHVVANDLFIEDVIVGVRMIVTYQVRPTPHGAVVTRSIEADLPRGIAGSVLSVLLRAKLRRMQKKLLRDLVAQAEAGS
jgi:hypothetical protein